MSHFLSFVVCACSCYALLLLSSHLFVTVSSEIKKTVKNQSLLLLLFCHHHYYHQKYYSKVHRYILIVIRFEQQRFLLQYQFTIVQS